MIFTDPYRRFLENLRAAREQTRLSQTEVGDALGIGQSDVAARERGSRKIDAFELTAFSKLYEAPVDEPISERTLRAYVGERRRGQRR